RVLLLGVEDAGGETDDAAARIVDRDRQPVAEAVVGIAIVYRDAQAGLDQHRLGELAERGFQCGAAARREAEAEAIERVAIGPAAAVGRPASISIGSGNWPGAAFSAVRLFGARPKPKRSSVWPSSRRDARYSRARAPSGVSRLARNQSCAACMTSWSPACCSALRASRGSGAGTSIPAWAASSLTASMNWRPRWSVIQRITSPCAPQPKRW